MQMHKNFTASMWYIAPKRRALQPYTESITEQGLNNEENHNRFCEPHFEHGTYLPRPHDDA